MITDDFRSTNFGGSDNIYRSFMHARNGVSLSWIEYSNAVLWSDSSIVISWINSNKPLKSYVANRVAQILDLTEPCQWRHVPTTSNPADIISRGCHAESLSTNELWWNGPEWLRLDSEFWPTLPQFCQEIPEQRIITLALRTSSPVNNEILNKYSTFMTLVRVTAWITRFIYNEPIFIDNVCIPKPRSHQRIQGPLSLDELSNGRSVWISHAQETAWAEDIVQLKAGQQVHTRSPLKSLHPFIDENGLIRVGGRLSQSDLSDSSKFPIVLPSKSKFVRLLFEYEHKRLLHVGPQALLSAIHQKYWPIRGRSLARRTFHKCIRCFRHNPRPVVQFMAPLPRSRVTIERPFARSGVDFCGSIFVRSGIRKVKAIKAYIAVFVCFLTRALHLELFTGLTSEAFLAAMKRFMSKRGQPIQMFSDNGTNFVGANKELQNIFKSGQVHNVLTSEGVDWQFIPPGSPHFGGLWEAVVKSAKRHLNKITNGNLFTYEETTTFLCQVEAILNSRSLTPLFSDPSDLKALTPSHFLMGSVLTCPSEPDAIDIPNNRLKRWQLVQKQTHFFWQRWVMEYLPQLQKRGRWISPGRAVKVGDLAVLRAEGSSPMRWPLVRVINTHPGADGLTRVVTVRGEGGQVFKRPVTKLSILPTEEDEEPPEA